MKTPKEKHPGEHRYLTHDNGGRPFLVYVGDTSVTVYQQPKNVDVEDASYDKQKDSYTKLVKKFTGVQKKFIPRYPTIKVRNYDFISTGNSILLELKNEYVFIGHCIYSFKTKDKIQKYFSFVGNSNVPYPVAVGSENVYFMLERMYVPKSVFPPKTDWEKDAYGMFYEELSDSDMYKMNGVKQIHGRVR
jgi:hypothetical protein